MAASKHREQAASHPTSQIEARRESLRSCDFVGVILPLLLLLVSACVGSRPGTLPLEEFSAVINLELVPQQRTIPDKLGNPQLVSVSRDFQGVRSEFVEGVVLLRPANQGELQDFLARFGGEIIGDDMIPPPPPELGITLTDEERQPTEYSVRVTLAAPEPGRLADDAATAGLQGTIEFSSEGGLQTFATVLAARSAGYNVGANWVNRREQGPIPPGAFGVLFETWERSNAPGPGFWNAFTEPRYGSQSNVTVAWQFVAAHGYHRRVWVAIIDGGFYLDNNGVPIGNDSDFLGTPLSERPVQFDFTDQDAFAGGPGPGTCGPANQCFWHGTGATGVAAGVLDNRSGAGGTGGIVANQMLFRFSGARDQERQAIRTAVAWGADVVSMSFGMDCNYKCRSEARDDHPFREAVRRGSRTVFVAAAGNGRVPDGSPPGTPNQGYDVGSPNFRHPCIMDHVICVGALAGTTNTAMAYSNFGVSVWAPTDIPVMSYPSSFLEDAAGNLILDAAGNPTPLNITQAFGTARPRTFGGTSASAPFVAGIAAMMKALNPELSSDQVSQILIATGRPGVAPVVRTVDALAAVRSAAEGIPNLPDRLEPNNVETAPADLGPAPPYNFPNLSIDSRDRDYYRFQSPGASTMSLQLEYPAGLGALSILSLRGAEGRCQQPILVDDAALVNDTGHRYRYRVPGGALLLGLAAPGINAYHLDINFTPRTFTRDRYEPNDTTGNATKLYGLRYTGGALTADGLRIDARFSINANIHHPGDIDYYHVRGSQLSLAEQVFIAGRPALTLSGNDSRINLQVFQLQTDGTQGTQLASITSAHCGEGPLVVPLEADAYYLVRVSGEPGNYTLQSGVSGDARRLPMLARDRVYEVLNPSEPIERTLRFEHQFVFAADPRYRAVRPSSAEVSLRLWDTEGNLVAESAAGEVLSLPAQQGSALQVLQLVPSPGLSDSTVVQLVWEETAARRMSDNLIQNPGAELATGESDLPNWEVPQGMAMPRIYFYGEGDNPAPDGPGPPNRGYHLFAGGSEPLSGMRQRIAIDPSWVEDIRSGRVRFNFSAYLGGRGTDSDHASVSLTFLDDRGAVLASVRLPTVTAREREGRSGLLPVALSDFVPAETRAITVEVTFHGGESEFNNGLADDLELRLMAG
jgi:hypothetical protein